MPSSSWTNTSGQWSRHRPSPVHRSWSIHTRMTGATISGRTRSAAVARYSARVQDPVAAQRPHTWNRPTGAVEDPWAWLRDRDDPATIAYLEAENEYCDAWFAARAG